MRGLSIGVNSQSAASAASLYSIFSNTDVPSIDTGDGTALGGLQVGTYFRTSVNGNVISVRFYKPSNANTSTRTAILFNAAGTKLGQIVIGNITGLTTGWNVVDFSTPIAITTGTDYIICMHQLDSAYPVAGGYFSTNKVSGVLTAPSTASTGSANGSYLYTSNVNSKPTETFNSSNYWVDIVFST